MIIEGERRMDQISVIEHGIVKEIQVIRYFQLNNIRYFVYSNQEVDGEYSKIYISKVEDEIIAINDEEWNLIKDIIKQMLKEISEGELRCVEDLDYRAVKGMNLVSSKPFKLSTQMTNLFAKNKKEFVDSYQEPTVEEESMEQSVEEPQEEYQSSEDYQSLYEEQKRINQSLEEELEKYKRRFAQIKEILEEE